MSKRRILSLSFFIVFLIYGLTISRFELSIIDKELLPDHPAPFFDYRGVVNVHTVNSSGSGTFKEVILAAQAADVDFLMITDLNSFATPENIEGYHDDLLVFWERELSHLNSRIINIDANDHEDSQSVGHLQIQLSDWLSENSRDPSHGIFILAHPNKPGYGWAGMPPVGFDGIEVVNLKSLWQDAWLKKKLSFIWTLIIYPFHPDLAFIRLFENAGDKEFKLFDRLAQRQPIIAIGGADAEANMKLMGRHFLKFPSYEVLFGLMSNHVILRSELTGIKSQDRQKILGAIKSGQFYVSFDKIADPKGFNFVLKTENGSHLLGDDVSFGKNQTLNIKLPQKPKYPFESVVFRNGKKWRSSNAKEATFPVTEPGVYRAIVRVIPTFPLPDGRKWMPWIMTNNIYIR